MSERDPSLTLNISDGRKVEMTPLNSTLYTFLGKTALGSMEIDNPNVNHVFVATGTNEAGQNTGMYFFNEFDPIYRDLAKHMTDHKYPMVLNQRVVPECDLKVWIARVDAEAAQFSAQIPDSL